MNNKEILFKKFYKKKKENKSKQKRNLFTNILNRKYTCKYKSRAYFVFF